MAPDIPAAFSGRSLAAALERLEGDRRTGTLRAGDEGALHIVDGAIAFAESRGTAGLDRLAGMKGMGDRDGREGREGADAEVLEVLGDPRLEALALLAMFDAAYFLLGSGAEAEFTEGPPHRLAPLCRIAPGALLAECARRGARLDAVWPGAAADRAPVVPVRRVDRQRVVLTGLQAEILLNADGRRGPAELARDLGRSTFGCLLAVRVLIAASLVRPPRPGAPGPPAAGPAPEPPPRRVRVVPDPGEAAGWEPVERDVLLRLRAGLEELA
ncbi:hypothetical protein [Spirillospora sp. NPDC029432]|uniref:hypothetical protein n=1 Tax=Spirillospora sp. NPDC029432 TaxID=3154599 RepID=UPI003456B0C2